MKEFYNILKTNNLFKNINEDQFDAALNCVGAYIQHYKKNEIIRNYENEVDEIGVIVRGSCHISKIDINGNRVIFLEINTGKSFGEAVAFSGRKNIFINITASTECSVIFLPIKNAVKNINKVCNINTIVENLLELLAQKTIALHIKADILSKKTIREKLMTYLEYECEATHSKTFKTHFSREELADYLGINRSAMGRELRKMQDEGILQINKNTFKIIRFLQ